MDEKVLQRIKFLGIAGMVGAPWMFIDFIENGLYERFAPSPGSNVRQIVFALGWLGSVLGLYFLKATGNSQRDMVILKIQMGLLVLAITFNINLLFDNNENHLSNIILTNFWPLAGFFMLVVGLWTVFTRHLKGWKPFIVLAAGLWFPFTLIPYKLTDYKFAVLVGSGIYSSIVFMLLGFAIVTEVSEKERRKHQY